MWFLGQSFEQSSDTWRSLARVASLCNRATFKPGQEDVPIPKVKLECFEMLVTPMQERSCTILTLLNRKQMTILYFKIHFHLT